MSAIKERPILFSGEMVRAILDGRKTQTRRAVKQWDVLFSLDDVGIWDGLGDEGDWLASRCPYGRPGRRLWVREAFAVAQVATPTTPIKEKIVYRADMPDDYDMFGIPAKRWTPSIHMPRSASRILLEVVSVRVERLHAMTIDDLVAEGIGDPLEDPESVVGQAFCRAEHAAIGGVPLKHHPEIYGYAALWDAINGPGAWDTNPWVWVVEFRRLEPTV
jgi:hypothetical protein